MSKLNINNATYSDMTNNIEDYSVAYKSTDGVSEQDETTWQVQDWEKHFGYFNEIADLKAAMISKSTWHVGKGYTTDLRTQVILNHIRGFGKDTFDDILFNMDLTSSLAGDSFAHIILGDDEDETLINLKPLDPSCIKIVVDKQGIIKRYEQTKKVNGKQVAEKTFKPEEIFHLCNNRVADQIHGISDLVAMKEHIDAEMENFRDVKKLMHHQVKPFIMWKLKTDDTTKISSIVSKIERARNLGEDMFIPDDDDAVSYEIVELNLSPIILAWREELRNKFYRTIGLPQVVAGAGGQSTESESKVIYLAAETPIERRQRYLEKQIEAQLGFKINLIPPTTLSENLQQDESKDPSMFQPSDTTAGVGR